MLENRCRSERCHWLRLLLFGLLSGVVFLGAAGRQATAADIEVFTRADCPHCRNARPFLDQLQHERPGLQIVYRDVDRDPNAIVRLRELAAIHKIPAVGVPAFFVNNELIVGFDGADTTGMRIREVLGHQSEDPTIHVPFFGSVRVSDLGLPAFTVIIGLLDGFNPCAMWVLLFLLSLLVNLGSRLRVLLIGGVFVITSGLVYFLFMAAWLNMFLIVGNPRVVEIILGAVAVGVGIVNLKDFVAFGRGLSLSIPASAKPAIYRRTRNILAATGIISAIIGAAVLASMVNVVELACTAGLPALYTHVLSLRGLSRLSYYGYLALYNLMYILDDALMLVIAVSTLRHFKLRERGGRWLKLVSGIVMFLLGALLLIRPDWLMA